MDLVESLKLIEQKLDDDNACRRREKILDSITGPVLGMGFFAMGLSLPTFSDAVGDYLRSPTSLEWLVSAIYSGLLIWIGMRLTMASIAVQAHFAERPEHLGPFLAIFEHEKVPAREFREWVRRPEIKGTAVGRQMARVVLAFQVGWWTLLVIGLVFVATPAVVGLILVKAVAGWPLSISAGALSISLALLGLQVARLIAYRRKSRLATNKVSAPDVSVYNLNSPAASAAADEKPTHPNAQGSADLN